MNNPFNFNIPYPLGTYYNEDNKTFYVSFEAKNEDAGVVFYHKKTGKLMKKVAIAKENSLGRIRYGGILLEHPENMSYVFYDGEKEFEDPRSVCYVKSGRYGVASPDLENKTDCKRACVSVQDFDWEKDRLPKIPYEDAVCYGMHVRGFTMHSSSKVKEKGTFAGVIQKIGYLKELGITTIVLQPSYEFNEVMQKKDYPDKERYMLKEDESSTPRINYWGYCSGYYYAPKANYAYGEDATVEFRRMVKELHKNQIEVIMQFYFPEEFDRNEIVPILRFWSLIYHVDGFQLMGLNMDTVAIAKDPGLCDRKLWYYDFDTEAVYDKEAINRRTLASFQEDYKYILRRFLKGEDGVCFPFAEVFRRNAQQKAYINYISDYQGFTLKDMFCYDRKHNEENGEDNRDGNDYNCSWNCGVEGECKKKNISALRDRQYRNAMTLLLLSQGTPYFFMGDEFLRTQKGNNNPYCQDNRITWVDWSLLQKNEAFFLFVKEMLAFRKSHPILRSEKMLRMIDRDNSGYPDLSFHGENPWKPDFFHYQHHLGIMLNGQYKDENSFIYIAVNLHWEKHHFSLPKLPKKMEWKQVISTDSKVAEIGEEGEFLLEPRSIKIFIGES